MTHYRNLSGAGLLHPLLATASLRQLRNLYRPEMKVQHRSTLEKPSLPLLQDRRHQVRVIGMK